ncbi:hypothetical protein CEXT_226711 [Caerostris extrusa]|uniref:Uncharacterized protein n=1 Tax=Caerostris extrusa TaxID=172846 RepID=A0AAV4M2Y5_CAEEX|nr:hypothetical protein CEXT_226711 [Caerostris extrusa]
MKIFSKQLSVASHYVQGVGATSLHISGMGFYQPYCGAWTQVCVRACLRGWSPRHRGLGAGPDDKLKMGGACSWRSTAGYALSDSETDAFYMGELRAQMKEIQSTLNN